MVRISPITARITIIHSVWAFSLLLSALAHTTAIWLGLAKRCHPAWAYRVTISWIFLFIFDVLKRKLLESMSLNTSTTGSNPLQVSSTCGNGDYLSFFGLTIAKVFLLSDLLRAIYPRPGRNAIKYCRAASILSIYLLIVGCFFVLSL
ncbi:hypothetical protein PT974_09504 [Cladobotryum mycophilum]|uniref:Uncharacterized protein n=1 Tax=Cladobotryum mycophilum TaxID=491253 RepID=A0ABR0SGG1_9HYPO